MQEAPTKQAFKNQISKLFTCRALCPLIFPALGFDYAQASSLPKVHIVISLAPDMPAFGLSAKAGTGPHCYHCSNQ